MGITVSPSPSVWLVLPFGLLLAGIALGPLWCADWWLKHYPKVAFGLAAITLSYYLGVLNAGATVLHTGREYLSFILLIGSLFVVSGGIHISVRAEATPRSNVLFLLCGAVLANVFGTTGASMLLIRPWLRMNQPRVRAYHVVFFIFIVSNVGGCLTPIGDPPLLLGYLKGIPFWWVPRYCWPMWAVGLAMLLGIFYLIERRSCFRSPPPTGTTAVELATVRARSFSLSPRGTSGERAGERGSPMLTSNANREPDEPPLPGPLLPRREERERVSQVSSVSFLNSMAGPTGPPPGEPSGQWRFEGLSNLAFLGAILGAVFIERPAFLREGVMLAAAVLSYLTTPKPVHDANQFSFHPLREVAVLFAGIFATMMPALDWLQGHARALGQPAPAFFYWSSGLLSSGLDNAPTYLSFLRLIYGAFVNPEGEIEAAHLLGNAALNEYLVAISVASVFFGANTYIGNAPNFMVKAIADQQKIHTPTFLAYSFKYALPCMGPMLVVVWWMFFRTR